MDLLPEELSIHHWEEGIIYAMTVISEKNIMYLGMVIECRKSTFIFRCFFVRGKKRKTYHQGAEDIEYQYSQVFRLAPRRELQIGRTPSEARSGQTLRFKYMGIIITARILQIMPQKIAGIIECGTSRGEKRVFKMILMFNCQEIFGSSILRDLYSDTDEVRWVKTDSIKTKVMRKSKPQLHEIFMAPKSESNKRK